MKKKISRPHKGQKHKKKKMKERNQMNQTTKTKWLGKSQNRCLDKRDDTHKSTLLKILHFHSNTEVIHEGISLERTIIKLKRHLQLIENIMIIHPF